MKTNTCNKEWQSWVENTHYSASLKIELKVDVNASGNCLCGSRWPAPSPVCIKGYGLQNTTHFGLANHCNCCHISKKLEDKIETRSGLLAWMIVYAPAEQRAKT